MTFVLLHTVAWVSTRFHSLWSPWAQTAVTSGDNTGEKNTPACEGCSVYFWELYEKE